eukprot:gene8683-6104_t
MLKTNNDKEACSCFRLLQRKHPPPKSIEERLSVNRGTSTSRNSSCNEHHRILRLNKRTHHK